MRVALIGPRGSGKSAVGHALAEREGVACVDTDAVIVERTGQLISELFVDGTFRRREREVVSEALRAAGGVVALGGGAILWEGIDAALADWAVVYLTADGAVLARRLRADGADRPSLTGAAPDEEIAGIAAARAERYSALADFSIATDNLDEGEVVGVLLEWLRKRRRWPHSGAVHSGCPSLPVISCAFWSFSSCSPPSPAPKRWRKSRIRRPVRIPARASASTSCSNS